MKYIIFLVFSSMNVVQADAYGQHKRPEAPVPFADPVDIARGSVQGVSSLDARDIDGDGKTDIVIRSLEPNQIHIFFQNDLSSWMKKSIPTDLEKSEGLGVGKMNADALSDVTFTGFLLRAPSRPRSQKYVKVAIDPDYHRINQNTKEAIGDIDGGGWLDVVLSPVEAYRGGKPQALAWYRNPGGDLTGTWIRTVVEASTNNIHTVKLAMMNGDDRLDIVAGVAWGKMSVKIYFNDGDGLFTSVQTVSGEKGLYSGVVTDIGKDSDWDIIGQETYAKSSRPYLYESLLSD